MRKMNINVIELWLQIRQSPFSRLRLFFALG
jgi:hypothetical protein